MSRQLGTTFITNTNLVYAKLPSQNPIILLGIEHDLLKRIEVRDKIVN